MALADSIHSLLDAPAGIGVAAYDGSRVELFSFYAHERSFDQAEFVGLTVEEGRRLKFAPDHPPRVVGTASTR